MGAEGRGAEGGSEKWPQSGYVNGRELAKLVCVLVSGELHELAALRSHMK